MYVLGGRSGADPKGCDVGGVSTGGVVGFGSDMGVVFSEDLSEEDPILILIQINFSLNLSSDLHKLTCLLSHWWWF